MRGLRLRYLIKSIVQHLRRLLWIRPWLRQNFLFIFSGRRFKLILSGLKSEYRLLLFDFNFINCILLYRLFFFWNLEIKYVINIIASTPSALHQVPLHRVIIMLEQLLRGVERLLYVFSLKVALVEVILVEHSDGFVFYHFVMVYRVLDVLRNWVLLPSCRFVRVLIYIVVLIVGHIQVLFLGYFLLLIHAKIQIAWFLLPVIKDGSLLR